MADLSKVIGRNKDNAIKLVKSLENSISRNAKGLQETKQRYEELMEKGKELAGKLAAASEYLQDLEQADES